MSIPSAAASGRRPGYWAQRSDAELVHHDFTASNPEALHNLLDEVPTTDEIPEVEFTYDTLVTGTGKVRCIHCKKVAKNHNRGFVLRFADGRRMLFGRDCGEKQYGAQFAHNQREFQHAHKRSDLLKRRNQIVELRPHLVGLLDQIEGHVAWEKYGRIRRQFVRAFPEVYADVASAGTRLDGALYADLQVRDDEAEAQYEERTGRKVVRYKRAAVLVHTVSGLEFFNHTPTPDKVVPQLAQRARNTLWTIGDADRKTRELELVFAGLRQLLDDLSIQASRFDALAAALTPANLAGIGRWLQHVRPGFGELRFEEGRIYRCNAKGVVRMFLPERPDALPVHAEMKLDPALPTAPTVLLDQLIEAMGS